MKEIKALIDQGVLHVRFTAVLVLSGLMLSAAHSPAATVLWSGAGGDDLWSNPANWTGDALPTSADDVVINVPGEVTVRMDAPNTTVRSLQCEESFYLENGQFTVTAGISVINGTFSMKPTHALAATGPTTVLIVNGEVTNVWTLLAESGAVLSLPTAEELTFGPGFPYASWSAYGAGSAIVLTNLTYVSIEPGYLFLMDAQNSGHIDVPRLRAPYGSLRVNAQGTNSLIDLSGFNGLWAQGFNGGFGCGLYVGQGGTVLIPNVSTMENVSLDLRDSANVNLDQLSSFTGASIYLHARTNGFPNLTNLSGSISASDSRLDWTNFTALQATNGSLRITAQDNSVIDLSGVTNVVMDPNHQLYLAAHEGGRINLRRLRQPNGAVAIDARFGSGLVDLSGFTGLWEGQNSSVRADDGGTVLIPNVTAMSKVSLHLSQGSHVPTEQLRSCTDVAITLIGRTNSLSGLTNFSGFLYVEDTRLDLTNFTMLYGTEYNQTYFQADRGSFIDLSRVTNVFGNGLGAYARGGSRIDLSGLHESEGPVSASAYDADSLINLSGLRGVWRGGYITAENGGTVLMPNVTALEGASLSVNADANINLAQLNSITAGNVTLRQRTNDLTGLTNFTGQLTATDSRLYLTNLTVLYVTNQMTFQAEQGSLIDLSRITNVVKSHHNLGLNAFNSTIDLSGLHVPVAGPFSVDARGPNGLVDLSGFSGLWDAGGGVSLIGTDGATVAIQNITETRGVSFNLSGDAKVPVAQLRSFREGFVRLSMQTNVFVALTNFNGSLQCDYQGRAEFPVLTQLSATNYSVVFSASSGGVVDLSQVTNAVAKRYSLSLSASYGGQVEIPNLETIVAGDVHVRADGTDSVVDLSGLTGFFSDNNGGRFTTSAGGVILLNSDAMLLAGVAIDFQDAPGGVLPPFLAPSQSLVLYGQPWNSYRIESRNPSATDSPWSLYRRVPLTGPLQMASSLPPRNLVLRVRVFVADPPEVDLRLTAPQTVEPVLFGVPGRTYRLETTTALGADGWQAGPTVTLTNSFFIFPGADTTNGFYQGRQL